MGLEDPSRVPITKPVATEPELRGLGYVLDHDKYGRFRIVEMISQIGEKDLLELGECRLEDRTECSPSSIVTLDSGTAAVLIEGSVSSYVTWLQGEVQFDVLGPAETFSPEEALSVANSVSPTADDRSRIAPGGD